MRLGKRVGAANSSVARDKKRAKQSQEDPVKTLNDHKIMRYLAKFLNIKDQLSYSQTSRKYVELMPSVIEKLKLPRHYNGFNFSKFTGLKEINFDWCRGLTAEQFNKLPVPASIKRVSLSGVNLIDFDFREFTGLKEICLEGSKNLTEQEKNSLRNRHVWVVD